MVELEGIKDILFVIIVYGIIQGIVIGLWLVLVEGEESIFNMLAVKLLTISTLTIFLPILVWVYAYDARPTGYYDYWFKEEPKIHWQKEIEILTVESDSVKIYTYTSVSQELLFDNGIYKQYYRGNNYEQK